MAEVVGIHWGSCCSSWTKLVRTPTRRTLVGKTVWKSIDGTWLGKNVPNWEWCLLVHRKQKLFLSVYVDDIKMARKKQNLASMWKTLMKRRWHWGANIISWSRLVRMHSTEMRTKRENHWTTQQDVRIPYFCWSNREINYQDGTNLAPKLQRDPTTWKDMLENAWNGIAIWQTRRRSNCTKFPVLVWTITKSKRKNWKEWWIFRSLLPYCMEMLVLWTNLVDLTFCWISARTGRQYLTACDRRSRESYIHHKWWPILSCGQCGSTLSMVFFFQDSDFAEILTTQNQHQAEFCAFLEVEHLYRSVGCARSNVTAPESEITSLDAGLRMETWWLMGFGHLRTQRIPKAHPSIKQVLDQNVDLSNVDQVPSNAHLSEKESQLYFFEDNEAVIKMIIKGMRHVSRAHRVAGCLTESTLTQKSKSNMSNPKTNSQTI